MQLISPARDTGRTIAGVAGAVLCVAVLLGIVYAACTGRLFLDQLPRPLANKVISPLYDRCITADSPQERDRAYRELVDRLGVQRLMRFHRDLYNQPVTAIALGRSDDSDAVALLRADASAPAWSGRKECALAGMIAAPSTAEAWVMQVFESLPPDRQWALVYSIIDQEQYRFGEVVHTYWVRAQEGDIDGRRVVDFRKNKIQLIQRFLERYERRPLDGS